MAFVRGFDMKAVSIGKSCASTAQRSIFTKSIAASAIPAHFNAAGVVDAPDCVLARPQVAKNEIAITVRAHRIGECQWIAEATWGSLFGHLPFDGKYPNQCSTVFQSRSEAVEHAINLALRQIKDQLGELADAKEWRGKVKAATVWAAYAITDTRKHDETLPLRGLTVIDLCAGGLGGFGMGMTSLGAEILLACEIDHEARSVYQQNVKPRQMHADLCTLDGTKLECDILTLGLLCQAFSKAGKRQGFADPVLANVYNHTKRLLREIKARVVVIECARQFLTQDGGKDADEVRGLLMKAGYRVQHRTLNASGFGVAQSRERSFIVATRLGLAMDGILGYVFPSEQAPTAAVEDVLETGIPHTIEQSQIVPQGDRGTERCTTLAMVGLLKTVKTQQTRNCQGYRLYSPKGLGPALTASGGGLAPCSGAFLINGHARGLTPREANRMQGMPEWAAHHATTSHALKHAGNAVAVPVARELGRQLGAILGRSF